MAKLFPIGKLMRKDSPYAWCTNKLFYVVFAPLSLAFVVAAVLSLHWRTVHDLPIMVYLGFLMDRFDYVPYRDFFDINLPGMHLISFSISRIVGHSDLGLRILDLGWLSAILIITWLMLKKINWKTAWAGSLLFGLSYLWYGPYQSLQREYLIILPLGLAVLVAFSQRRLGPRIKPLLLGLLFGICATIKLHAAIGFPLVLWFVVWDRKRENESIGFSFAQTIKTIAFGIGGFILPLIVMIVYLGLHNAWRPFWDIVTNYWPLYSGLAVNHQTIFGFKRVLYLFERYTSLGSHGLWVVPASLGAFVAIYFSTLTPAQKRKAALLGGMAILYSFYPLAAGQFWSYHWLLFHYFILLVSSLCLVDLSGNKSKVRRLFPFLALIFVICLRIATPHHALYQEKFFNEIPKGGKVDEIAGFLKENLKPGDEVQPLDWADGAVHAMLIAEAKTATRFIYAFSFYHHISEPYIQRLRREFLGSLDRVRPRFVIKMKGGFPWVRGQDTTKDFAQLDRFLAAYYTVALESSGYVIYERAR